MSEYPMAHGVGGAEKTESFFFFVCVCVLSPNLAKMSLDVCLSQSTDVCSQPGVLQGAEHICETVGVWVRYGKVMWAARSQRKGK